MSDKIIENNQVTIMGEVASRFTFSHEVFGEGFYMVDVLVKRLSNSEDRIPLMISERLIDVTKDYTGEFIMASGQFRSYNRHEEHKNHLVLSVFVREVAFVDEELDAVLGELFARPVVILAALHQLVIAGVEICGLAEVLRAHLRVIRNHRVDGLLIDGTDVAADEVCAGFF